MFCVLWTGGASRCGQSEGWLRRPAPCRSRAARHSGTPGRSPRPRTPHDQQEHPRQHAV